MPSYQPLCLVSSSPQPSASSLATTLIKVISVVSGNSRKGEQFTRHISWTVPLLFPLDDGYVFSSPKRSTDQRAMVTNPIGTPGQSCSARRQRKLCDTTHLYTSFQTISLLIEERRYI